MPVKAKVEQGAGRFGRRRLIKAAVAGGMIAAASAVVAVVRSGGYELPAATRAKLAALEPWQYIVVEHLARRICAPDADGVVTADETGVASFVDGYVAKMPKKLRRDLLRLLAFVEQLAPASVALASRFTHLSPSDQDKVLASLEASSSDLLRGGFEGVKALCFMGYYKDPRTWTVLGYDGPLLGRVEQ